MFKNTNFRLDFPKIHFKSKSAAKYYENGLKLLAIYYSAVNTKSFNKFKKQNKNIFQ